MLGGARGTGAPADRSQLERPSGVSSGRHARLSRAPSQCTHAGCARRLVAPAMPGTAPT